MKKSLGRFLSEQREEHGFTIRALAKYAKVSHPYLSQVESDLKVPSSKWLAKIAPVIGVSNKVLLEYAGYVESEPGVKEPLTEYMVEVESLEEKKLVEDYRSFVRKQALKREGTNKKAK